MKFARLKVFGAAIAVAAMGLATSAVAQTEMTYAHSENPSAMTAAQAFKTMVEGRSGGQLTVNLVIHGALGSDRDVVDQLTLGELEMYVPGVHGLNAIAPNFQLFDAPYLFTDRREFYALMTDPEFVEYVRAHLLQRSGGNIRFMGAAENSVRNLYSKAGPIRVPDELRAIKLRVSPGPLNIAMWEGLGVGSVVGLSGSERNQALQTGIIDAVEGSLSGAAGAGHLDILNNITMSGHAYSYMAYVLNNEFYEGLSADLQSVIDEAIYLSIIVQNGAAIVEEQQALAEAQAKGNVVTVLTAEELAQWKDRAFPIGQDFIAKELDADFVQASMDALDRIRAGFSK
ncbi:MAG: TRAP transporter substrate-binding protein [Pseudorhodobacter sp.]